MAESRSERGRRIAEQAHETARWPCGSAASRDAMSWGSTKRRERNARVAHANVHVRTSEPFALERCPLRTSERERPPLTRRGLPPRNLTGERPPVTIGTCKPRNVRVGTAEPFPVQGCSRRSAGRVARRERERTCLARDGQLSRLVAVSDRQCAGIRQVVALADLRDCRLCSDRRPRRDRFGALSQ